MIVEVERESQPGMKVLPGDPIICPGAYLMFDGSLADGLQFYWVISLDSIEDLAALSKIVGYPLFFGVDLNDKPYIVIQDA